jgi:hypothetical protein
MYPPLGTQASREIIGNHSCESERTEKETQVNKCANSVHLCPWIDVYTHTHNENSITHILTHAHTAGHTHVRTKNMHTHAYTCAMTSRFRSAVISSCVRVDVKDSSVCDCHIHMHTHVIRSPNFKENTVLVSPSSSVGARTSHVPLLHHRCLDSIHKRSHMCLRQCLCLCLCLS